VPDEIAGELITFLDRDGEVPLLMGGSALSPR
jgi:hypothetical protein